MTGTRIDRAFVGRILTGTERAIRMTRETADRIPDEELRSAFVITRRHALTAWHCVREQPGDPLLWLRLREGGEPSGPRRAVYVPLRVSFTDMVFDVAVLMIDIDRLTEVGLTPNDAEGLFERWVIPLAVDVATNDHVSVMGFPVNSSSADSDTQSAQIVDPALPLGDLAVLKLYTPAFAAVDPVDPRGLSGGPVLRNGPDGPVAVGIVRGVPRGKYSDTALGGALVATRIEDLVSRIPEIAQALTNSPDPVIPIPTWLPQNLAIIDSYRSSGLLIDDREYRDLRKDRLLRYLEEQRRRLDTP